LFYLSLDAHRAGEARKKSPGNTNANLVNKVKAFAANVAEAFTPSYALVYA